MAEADFETYLKLAADSGGIRYEVLGGIPYSTGVPGWRHQNVLLSFAARLYSYVWGKSRGNRRSSDGEGRSILVGGTPVVFGQASPAVPDLLYAYLEPGQYLPDLESEPLEITPDLIVEVVGVDSRWLDRDLKVEVFGRAGIREYWILDPEEGCVLRFNTEPRASSFEAPVIRRTGLLESCVVGGFEVDVSEVLNGPGGN